MPRVQLGKYPVCGDPNSLKQTDIYIKLLYSKSLYYICVCVCLRLNTRRLGCIPVVVIIIDDPVYKLSVSNILYSFLIFNCMLFYVS